jgi:ATP-dependent Clp protease ATP-binding subunit ClpA
MEPHTVSKFIGSPAGYVGHDDGGQLTNAIKRNPYSLILFDEIEKAHPKIFDILLQVLDDGRLRDGKGQVVDFSNTIIVFTSNIGGSDLANIPNKVVRNKEKMRLLQETYRPEFLNRLDCISVFNKLDMVNLIEILNRNLDNLAEKLWKDRYISIMVSDEFKAHLISSIDIEAFGARPLNRLISSEIEDKVTDLILDGKLEIGSEIIFEMADDKIIVEVV